MIGSVFYHIFITPLELIFEIVFRMIYRSTGIAAVAIIGLSLVMNFLVLPLYKRADAIQEEERDKVASMSKWVSHIKKTFKGDERYMMLNTYYRQQNYKPIYALRSSFSLLLQIPFFIAAYHYLSNLPLLNGASFLFLKDLGAPDQLITIGSVSINLMPIIMTLINFISGFIYLRGFPLKDKIQTYGIGIIFLVLLYNSPSGLVFYWTLNQIFSMLKNVFMKLVKSRKVLNAVFSIAGVLVAAAAFLFVDLNSGKKIAVVILLFLACQMPLVVSLVRKKVQPREKSAKETKYRTFLLGGIFLSIFIGAIIPLSVISSAPIEFVTKTATPAEIVVLNLATAVGYFIVWFGIFYYLASKKGKRVFLYILWVLAGVCVVDFMFFGRNLGTISSFLKFDTDPVFSAKEKILNLAVLIGVAAVMVLFLYFFERFLPYVYLALIIGGAALSVINSVKIHNEIKSANLEENQVVHGRDRILPLSKEGKNVIVFMLDRAISGYVPYIFNEKPEIKEAFAGFTYYPNTISFGTTTNIGAPALFGGYEYHPLRLNERSDELLVDKHDESLKVMPKLFSENGFEVTVCDPPLAGYRWGLASDLSIYEGLENVKAYHTIGEYITADDMEKYSTNARDILFRNFFMYSVFKSVPVVFMNELYDYGNYYSTAQNFSGYELFIDSYSTLEALPDITDIRESEENTFLMIDNDTAHEPVFLEYPEYVPTSDPNAPHLAPEDSYQVDGKKLIFSTDFQIQHYDVNMAAFMKFADWLNYLKEQGVYDNTRIIVVADHARNFEQFPDLITEWADVSGHNPLLMVKDFGSTEYLVSDEFMTNADVPVLAMEGLIEDPENPYTGNRITGDAKKNEDMIITTSFQWNIDNLLDSTTVDFSDGVYLSVHDNIFNKENWQLVE